MTSVFEINNRNLIIFIALIIILFCTIRSPIFGKSSFIENGKVDIRNILSVSIEMAVRGGKRVKAVRNSDDIGESSKGKNVEGKKDVLTMGDLQSHLTIMAGLKRAFPSLNVISEEHTKLNPKFNMDDTMPSSKFVDPLINKLDEEMIPVDELVVWVDPLDATYEYSQNLIRYVTTMVCVARNGRPIIGIIHRPFLDQTVWSYDKMLRSKSLDDMISSNKKSEYVEDSTPIQLVVSRSHRGDVEKTAKEIFALNNKLVKRPLEIQEAAGAGFKVLEVLSGRADVYMHTTKIKKWDFCAGDAILQSVGGSMTTLKGNKFDYSDSIEGAINEKGLLSTFKEKHSNFIDNR